MRKYPKSNEDGLTIIETLVAVFILISSIAASLYLISRNLASATLIKNEVVAVHLAEEGMEVVRNLRDGDWHSGRMFGSSIPGGTYRVAWDSTALLPAGADALKLDDGTGLYNYNTGSNTPFVRTILISINPGEDLVRRVILVSVNWNERGVLKTIAAEEHLYNWK